MGDESKPVQNEKKSFWDTATGTVTKITAFVLALSGLVVAIKSLSSANSGKSQTEHISNSGNSDLPKTENSPQTNDSPKTEKPAPATYTDYLQMMDAIKEGRVKDAKDEMEKGADVNKNDAEGYSPLIRAVYAKNYQIVESLVRHKADVNSTDNKINSTALIEASYLGLLDIVKLLLANNADPNIAKGSYTALMATTNKEQPFNKDHKLVFCELLTYGADPNARFNGSTALDFVKGDWPGDVTEVENMIRNCKK